MKLQEIIERVLVGKETGAKATQCKTFEMHVKLNVKALSLSGIAQASVADAYQLVEQAGN